MSNELNFEVENNDGRGNEPQTISRTVTSATKGLGALTGRGVLGRNSGNTGRLQELTEKLVKGFETLDGIDLVVHPLNKKEFPNLAYPGLLVEIGGSAVLLVVSDNKTVTPTVMVQGLQRGETQLFLRSDVIDDVYAEACASVTDSALIDAYIVPPEMELTDAIVGELILVTHDICVDFNNKRSGDSSAYINLADIITSDVEVNCVEQSVTTDATTVTGNKKRADWMITTTAEERMKRSHSPNNSGAQAELNRASGYVNLIPVIMETVERGQVIRTNSVVPEIVLNNVMSQSIIAEHGLIAIATSALVAADYKWVTPLVDNITDQHNPSAFDGFLDIESKYLGKGVSRQQKINNITQSITNSPRLKLVVEKGAIDDAVFSLFALGADYNNPDSRYAREDIITTAVQMTDKKFNADFSPDEIFTAVEIPAGYYFDNKGVMRDIAEIDIMFCYSVSEELAIRYERILLGIDPADYIYTIYSELENTLGLDIHLTGRKYDITFKASFINELTMSLERAGFAPYVEPSNVVAKTVGYDYTIAATSGTFLDGGIAMGRQRGQSGYGPVGRRVGSYRNYR